MEPPEVLKLLESNNPEVVEEIKQKFHEQFNMIKDSWLLYGMVDYFISTKSMRCVDVIVGVREPHDKHFFDKMCECLKNPSVRFHALTLFGHVVFRQPPWLFKITQHSLFKEILKLLKTETDIINIVSALLTFIVLLPMIPAYVGPHLQDIFEVFSRLAAWNANNPNKIPEEHLIHLQVSLQSFFHRLYGMYPCNFVAYLRKVYSLRENMDVFTHTVKPLLETVKVHPLLITASADSETTTSRWKTMEHHDVVAECAKLSATVRDESIPTSIPTFKPRSESEIRRCIESATYLIDPNLPRNTIDPTDFWSPSLHCSSSTPSLKTPESSGRNSIPETPITQSYVIGKYSGQEGTSPPEAAIEATPETTPIKDSRDYSSPRPGPSSTVARALNTFTGVKPRHSISSTPSESQPPSPLKKESSPFRFHEAPALPEALNESSTEKRRKESLFSQRLNSLFQDRLNIAADKLVSDKFAKTARSPVRPYTPDTANVSKDSNTSFKFEEPTIEDQEVSEISRLAEKFRIGSGVPLNFLRTYEPNDIYISDMNFPREEGVSNNQTDVGPPDSSIGRHVQSFRTMLNFPLKKHRSRYYSQCKLDSHPSQIEEFLGLGRVNQEDPSSLRRAHSCPDMIKDIIALLEAEPFEESDFEHEKNEPLDEKTKQSVGVSTSTQTQSDEAGAAAYPSGSVIRSLIEPAGKPASTSKSERYSPTSLLNTYIEVAAGLYEDRKKKKTLKPSSIEALELELKTVKDQLTLSNLQLKFERQRRELHAERNRRLMGKCRNNRWLEDHNYALRDQLVLLERDIQNLTRELERNKKEVRENEAKLLDKVSEWQEKYAECESRNRKFRAENDRLTYELARAKEQAATLLKEKQHAQAMLFTVTNELKEATAQASLGEQLKTQNEYLQRELLAMSETQQIYRNKISELSMRSDHEAHAMAVKSYLEEVKKLKDLVDLRTSTLEAMKGRVTDLEATISKKDLVVTELKRIVRAVKEECHEKVSTIERKYKAQIGVIQKLEEGMLEMHAKLEVATRRRKGNLTEQEEEAAIRAELEILSAPLPTPLQISPAEAKLIAEHIEMDSNPLRDLRSILDEQEAASLLQERDEQKSNEPPAAP